MTNGANVREPQSQSPVADDKVRELFGCKSHHEVSRIQDWIGRWHGTLPPSGQSNVKGRLQKDDIKQFTGAFFELQMLAMLSLMEHETKVEPAIAGAEHRPDFFARNRHGSFYLEATVCGQNKGVLHTPSNEEDAVRKIKSNLPIKLEKANIDFHSLLSLRTQGSLKNTLSKDRVVTPFVNLMGRTTPEEIQASYGRRFEEKIQEGDWRLTGTLKPKPYPHFAGRVIGPARVGFDNPALAIRRSLQEKAKKWKKSGPSDEFFIIAASICHSCYQWNDGDELTALDGGTVVQLDSGYQRASGGEPIALKGDTTAQSKGKSWLVEFSNIAGVLFVGDISPLRVQTARAKLVLNPDHHSPEPLMYLADTHGLSKGRTLTELTGFPTTSK